MRLASAYIYCCWIFILVLGQLKPVEENEEENQCIYDIINIMNKSLRINNFVTISRNLNLGKSFTIRKSLEQRLMESFTRPVIAVGHNQGKPLRLMDDQNIAIIYFSDFHDPLLNVVAQAEKGWRIISLFFVYQPQNNSVVSKTEMELFFTWCWENNIIFSLLVFKRNNEYEVWCYEMRPKLWMYNYIDYISRHWNKRGIRRFKNMEKQRCLVALYTQFPETFVYNSSETHDPTGSNVSLGGRSGYFISEFLRFINGSMEILLLSKEEYLKAIAHMRYQRRNIDIAANINLNVSLSHYSPMVTALRACLVLPYERLASNTECVFCVSKWPLIVLMALYFIVNTLIRGINNPRMSISSLLFWNLRLFISQPMDDGQFQRLGLPTKIITICTQIFNILMVTIYCGFLTMSLTLDLRKSNIVDVESFLASELRIMVYGNEMHKYFEVNGLPMALMDRLLIVDQRTRNEHIYSLNDSYAYISEGKHWVQLQFMQKRLMKHKLRLAPSTLCGIRTYYSLPLGSAQPFTFMINWFLTFVRESGLSDRWMLFGLWQAEQVGMFAQAPYEPDIRRSLELKFFESGFTVLVVGLLFSLAVFVMELVYTRMIRRFRNKEVVS